MGYTKLHLLHNNVQLCITATTLECVTCDLKISSFITDRRMHSAKVHISYSQLKHTQRYHHI